MTRVTIIGAGPSGLLVGRALQDKGHEVTILEKSRGPSGRLSSKRTPCGSIDMGLQLINPESDAFKSFLEDWKEKGLLEHWQYHPEKPPAYVAIPRMTAITRKLSEDLTLRTETRATALRKKANGWIVEIENGDPLNSDFVILATPAPQAAPLLEAMPDWQARVAAVEVTPNWTQLLAFDPGLQLSQNSYSFDSGPIAWIANNSSKPGREQVPETWTLQSSVEWAEEHVDADKHWVSEMLTKYFLNAVNRGGAIPCFSHTHRWLYSQTKTALGEDFLYDKAEQIAVCGDWCLGDTLEHAYLSATRLSVELIESLD